MSRLLKVFCACRPHQPHQQTDTQGLLWLRQPFPTECTVAVLLPLVQPLATLVQADYYPRVVATAFDSLLGML
jgi:hypothetical protein